MNSCTSSSSSCVADDSNDGLLDGLNPAILAMINNMKREKIENENENARQKEENARQREEIDASRECDFEEGGYGAEGYITRIAVTGIISILMGFLRKR